MPHVTFIHGLANKCEAKALLRAWGNALGRDDGLQLGALGVTTTMVYWADVLYPSPDPNVADYENYGDDRVEAVDGGGDAELPAGDTAEERVFLEAARERMTDRSNDEIAAAQAIEPRQPARLVESEIVGLLEAGDGPPKLERVPLPWFIKERIMKAYIRDAYLYLFDKEFSPRPGERYYVRQELRRRFIEELTRVEEARGYSRSNDDRHIVVSHSMGTMIAYDCLKRVEECPAVDGLITMGSPLGVDEIQDKFKPGWTRADGFPDLKVQGDWFNISDPFDVVCAAQPEISGDFRFSGAPRIVDSIVTNNGAWRHSVVKYLARKETRVILSRMLGISGP